MSEERGNPVRGFFGGLLMAVGWLIAALSGLCTAFFVVGSLFDGGGGGGGDNVFAGGDVLVMALVIGGVPIGIGVGLFFLGRSLYRSAQPRTSAAPPQGPVS